MGRWSWGQNTCEWEIGQAWSAPPAGRGAFLHGTDVPPDVLPHPAPLCLPLPAFLSPCQLNSNGFLKLQWPEHCKSCPFPHSRTGRAFLSYGSKITAFQPGSSGEVWDHKQMSKCFLQIKDEWKIKQCSSPRELPGHHCSTDTTSLFTVPWSESSWECRMLRLRGAEGALGAGARTPGRSLGHGLVTVSGRGPAAPPGVGSSSGPHWLTSGAAWIWKSLLESPKPLPRCLHQLHPPALTTVPPMECFVNWNSSLPILIRDVAEHLNLMEKAGRQFPLHPSCI